MNSDTSSEDVEYESINEWLEEQDTITYDLKTECEIQSAFIEILKR